MAPTAGLLIVGILLHRMTPVAPVAWLVIAVILLVCGWMMLSRRLACGSAVAGASILLGLGGAQLHALHYPSHHIGRYSGDVARLAELEIHIQHPPRVLVLPSDGKVIPPRQVTLGRAQRIRTGSGWSATTGDLLVQIREAHPSLRIGQKVRVLGYLQRPAPAMTPGQFDWADYYRDQRIIASLTIPAAGNVTVLADNGTGPLGWMRESVRFLLASGFSSEDWLDHALLRALLLGDADPELRDIQDQFRATGTSHHLSISGLHVAVLGGFVYLFCRMLCVRPRAAAFVMTGFVIFYGLVALPSPPVVRSVILSLAFAIGITGRRAVDGLQLLCLSAVLMLMYHPMDLYNAGFQLSFGTVAGLMLFTSPIRGWLSRQRDIDQQLAPQEPGLINNAARWADGQMMTVVAASFVAWIVSMPMVAFHFGQLNPWAVPASILLAPAVFASLIAGFLKVLFTLFLPSLASIWAAIATWPVDLMQWELALLAQLPKSDVPLPAPHPALLVVFYAGLLLALLRTRRLVIWWTMRLIPLAALLAMLVLPFHSDVLRSTSPLLRITLLHVGAGQCAVIEPPGGRVVMADAGSLSLADPLRKCIVPYLRHRGITDVDTLLISHGDFDHFSAASAIAEAYDVREALVGHAFAGAEGRNPAAVDLLRRLDELERPPRVLTPGDVIPLSRDTTLQVLWPPAEVNLPDNDCSVVFKLTHAGKRILFTGDIQEAALRALLRDKDKLRAEILVAPHHGSAEQSTRAFLDAVDPELVISSNDRTLSNKQVRFESIAKGRQLLRTHTSGAITISIGADGVVSVETALPQPMPVLDSSIVGTE